MIHKHHYISFLLLIFSAALTSHAHAEQQPIDLYKSSQFVLGIGTAIVSFDTNIKVTDKQKDRRTYLDLEGNLDLPEISTVITLYGGYQINAKHSIGFSFFNINRKSDIVDFDKTLEEVRVVGNASISDTTDFYRLEYGYNLFNDNHSKIDLMAGIYALDLKYEFNAEGTITIGGISETGVIEEEESIIAPLPLLGLNFRFRITDSWNFATRLSFVAGSYEDLSATVFQTSIQALYKVNRHFGLVMGVTTFDADVVIEDDKKKQNISYGYDGAYIGMHFLL